MHHYVKSQCLFIIVPTAEDAGCMGRGGAEANFTTTKLKKNNVAFALNTDSVALYKSSSWSLWPVYLSILNLPPSHSHAGRECHTGWWTPEATHEPSVMKSLETLLSVGTKIRTPNGVWGKARWWWVFWAFLQRQQWPLIEFINLKWKK